MAINKLSPTTFTTAVLIGDTAATTGGSNDIPPVLTTVGNLPIAAALELQSTLGAFIVPRMTTTQKLALTPIVNGAQVFDSTLGQNSFYTNGAWGSSSSPTGIQTTSVTLTQAQVQGMYAAPVVIVPAPAAGFSIVVMNASLVNNFNTTAFVTGGGPAILQYAATIHGAGTDALSGTIAATFVTAGASTLLSFAGSAASLTGVAAAGLYMSNTTGAFTAGNAASTIVVNVWYMVIPANV